MSFLSDALAFLIIKGKLGFVTLSKMSDDDSVHKAKLAEEESELCLHTAA